MLVGLAGAAEAVPWLPGPPRALSAAVPSRRWLTMVRRHLAQQAGAWMEVESIRRLPAALEGSSASPCARSRRGSSGHPRRGTRVHRNSPIPRRIQASIAAWSTPDPATFPPGLSCARGTGGRLLQDFDAHGGARDLVTMIVDELPGLIVHPEGAHFGSSPRGRIAHFDGAGAGGKFTTISGQYLDKLEVLPGPIASLMYRSRRTGRCCLSQPGLPSAAARGHPKPNGRRTRPDPHRQASLRQGECGSNTGVAAPESDRSPSSAFSDQSGRVGQLKTHLIVYNSFILNLITYLFMLIN